METDIDEEPSQVRCWTSSAWVSVMTSPELLSLVAAYDDGPLSFLRYREVCRAWLDLSRSEALLSCVTSSEACVAYKYGSSYRIWSRAWNNRSFKVRQRAGTVVREVGGAVSVGRHRFFFEWLEPDSEAIAIWDLDEWWQVTVSRTEPSANHVASGAATCVRGHNVYLCGGLAADGSALASIFVLDTAHLDRGWHLSSHLRLEVAVTDAVCAVVDEELVVIGGCTRKHDGAPVPALVVQFVRLSDGATRVTALPADFHRSWAAAAARAGVVYVAAGGSSAVRWDQLRGAPHDELRPQQRVPCQAVVKYDVAADRWTALDFPLLIRDRPSIAALPDGTLLVAGIIAKALDTRLAGALDVDDCSPMPPMIYDGRKWAPFTCLDPYHHPKAPRHHLLTARKLNDSNNPADHVVSDLAVLDLAVVHDHVFRPKLNINALLPRDQRPPALLHHAAHQGPQSGRLWWYAERAGRIEQQRRDPFPRTTISHR